MEIKDLKSRQGSVDIKATIKSVEEPKVINKFGRELKLANAIITDGTGEIKLTAWNNDADKLKVGAIIKITNGYVNEFQGEKQLTSGKFGKLEFVGEDEESNENQEEINDKKESEEQEKLEDNDEDDSDGDEEPSDDEVGDY